jgi:hypothetical protein
MSLSERDLQSKLDEMEAEVNQNATSDRDSSKSIFSQLEINPSPQVRGWIDTGKAWFNSLPKAGKAAVAIGGVWLGFSILGAVLHVVSSVLTVGAIGLILYVGYRLFGNSSDEQS